MPDADFRQSTRAARVACEMLCLTGGRLRFSRRQSQAPLHEMDKDQWLDLQVGMLARRGV